MGISVGLFKYTGSGIPKDRVTTVPPNPTLQDFGTDGTGLPKPTSKIRFLRHSAPYEIYEVEHIAREESRKILVWKAEEGVFPVTKFAPIFKFELVRFLP